MKEQRKVRVNITVDRDNLKKAKSKLKLFGGKLSTLFDAYLADFVKSMDKEVGISNEEVLRRLRELENKIEKIGEKK